MPATPSFCVKPCRPRVNDRRNSHASSRPRFASSNDGFFMASPFSRAIRLCLYSMKAERFVLTQFGKRSTQACDRKRSSNSFSESGLARGDATAYDTFVLGLCKVFMAVISFRLSFHFSFLSSNLKFDLKHFHVTALAHGGSIVLRDFL